MEGEEGLGMTRIRMSTLNLCSGNQCEWTLVLLPLWPAYLLSCWVWSPQWPPASSPPHPALPCNIPTSCSMLTHLSAQKTGPELRGRHVGTNAGVRSLL